MAHSDAAVIRESLAAFVVDQRIEPADGPLRATIYHLIARRHVRSYRRAADTLLPSLAPLRLAVTGPWPPFAFVPELWP
jgi:hypothetical protein